MTIKTLSRRTVLAVAGAVLAGKVFSDRWLAGTAAAAGDSRTHLVEIRDFVFAPDSLEVRPGDRITWINRDIVPHTATADDESWDSGELGMDEAWQLTVEPGMKADYFCRFHPMMKARLEIRQA